MACVTRLSPCSLPFSSEDGASHGFDEPQFGIVLGNALELAYGVAFVLAVVHALALAAQDYVEVHAENTSLGVVLDSEVDVFINAKAKVTYVIINK